MAMTLKLADVFGPILSIRSFVNPMLILFSFDDIIDILPLLTFISKDHVRFYGGRDVNLECRARMPLSLALSQTFSGRNVSSVRNARLRCSFVVRSRSTVTERVTEAVSIEDSLRR
jgi:hypothetical protein